MLVGPTGSGKSTVIDAMSFALYGTVPRWKDKRMVMYALAPTAVRGTVRLVFDVAGARYQVVRELRRAAKGQVSIKNARFERLADRNGTGEVGEQVEFLEADGQVNRKVEELLGLPFEHFCKCVSLPQGAFAEFLHAAPRERDDILRDLLGLGLYEQIGARAREEAAAHRQSAAALAEQLGGYADATEEAERTAAERVEHLAMLAGTVEGAVAQLKELTTAAGQQAQRHQQLRADVGLLTSVAAPAGLDDLAARRAAALEGYAQAEKALAAADEVDADAREALRAAPPRGPLETAARGYEDLAAALTAEPGLAGGRADAEQRAASAEETARTAAEAADAARETRDAVSGRHRDAVALATRLDAELTLLTVVTPPVGIAELADRLDQARSEHDAATVASTAADETFEAARTAVRDATGRRSDLQRAAGILDDIARLAGQLPELETRLTQAAGTRDEAAGKRDAARSHLEHTQSERDRIARTDLAAALRPQLTAGADCPVCAQPVATLPPSLPAADLEKAEQLLSDAKTALTAADKALADADRAHGRLEDEQRLLTGRIDEQRGLLAELPDDREAISSELAAIEQLSAAETEADTARSKVRSQLTRATETLRQVDAERQSAARLLAEARDPLVALGAPPADAAVAAGWQQLHSWASSEADSRRERLTGAQEDVEREAGLLTDTQQAFDRAAATATQAHRDEVTASGAAATAKALHDTVTSTIARLREQLTGQPDEPTVRKELERIDALEQACRETDGKVQTARGALEHARRLQDEIKGELDDGWRRLRAARDPLVRFDAPELSGQELAPAWAQLCSFAAAEAAARGEQAEGAEAQRAGLQADYERAAAQLTEQLADAGVSVRPDAPLAGVAEVALTRAAAEAAAARDRLVERRREAADLETRRAAAESQQRVAAYLGNLLRTDNFPRWLSSSALNTLLMEASKSLLELSGGQFELTHDGTGGDLLIVDHADADSRRPVKTLSGGETFQASLALALALSSQMAALAQAGAARLDSIFLDEGFGTLDESTLEIVADTLETLAGQKERMVGVITHVPALAERIPVKFAVARDASSSRVVRNGT